MSKPLLITAIVVASVVWVLLFSLNFVNWTKSTPEEKKLAQEQPVSQTQETGPAAEKTPFSKADIDNTVWMRTCDNCGTKVVYVHLRSDGIFGHNFKEPGNFAYTGENDHWRFEDHQLTLEWNKGYSIEKFGFTSLDGPIYLGTKSGVSGSLRLELIQRNFQSGEPTMQAKTGKRDKIKADKAPAKRVERLNVKERVRLARKETGNKQKAIYPIIEVISSRNRQSYLIYKGKNRFVKVTINGIEYKTSKELRPEETAAILTHGLKDKKGPERGMVFIISQADLNRGDKAIKNMMSLFFRHLSSPRRPGMLLTLNRDPNHDINYFTNNRGKFYWQRFLKAQLAARPFKPKPVAGTQQLQAKDMWGTVWKELCTYCSIAKISYIKFRSDGTFGSNSSVPSNFSHSDNNRWKVVDNMLVVNWNNSYFVGKYRLGGSDARTLQGRIITSKSGVKGPLKLVLVKAAATARKTDKKEPASSITQNRVQKAEVSQVNESVPPLGKRSSSIITMVDYKDTIWKRKCSNCDRKVIYYHLRVDGAFGYNFNDPKSFIFDGTDKWRLEDNKLILSWTNGYSIESYEIIDISRKVFGGTKSNVRGPIQIELLKTSASRK